MSRIRRAIVRAAPTCKLWWKDPISDYLHFRPVWGLMNWMAHWGYPRGVTVYWTPPMYGWKYRVLDAASISRREQEEAR